MIENTLKWQLHWLPVDLTRHPVSAHNVYYVKSHNNSPCDVVKQKYLAIREPIDLHFAAPQEKTWKEAKDQERATWMLKHQLPVECKYPKTAIKEMECNNKKQLLAQAFNEEWENKVRSGWKPEGAEY
ncbi:MAG: hypothetical protein KKH12_10635 [Gammaproteobacteria bacterium]|nr:hypothetical protein [Gammaproteobacteria bacterium]MBU1482116.1 hypothetical protein [Gammaproteobacteria bacterium]